MDIGSLILRFIEDFNKQSKREKNYVSNNTLKTYQINLFKFIEFLRKSNIDTNIKKITEEHIITFINELVDKKLSPATRNQYISTLKSFFKWASKSYSIKKNPVKEVKTAYQTRKEAKYFTTEDYNSFISFIDKIGGINQLIFRTLLQTGMRANELISLNIDNITFEKDMFLIKVIKGKGNKERVLPFRITNEDMSENKENLKLYNLLWTYIKNRKKDDCDEKEALFISNRKERITYQGLNKKFKILMKKLNLRDKKYSLHTCRHTCAKRLLENNARLKVVQIFLGHEDPITTLRIYDHCDLKEIAEINKF